MEKYAKLMRSLEICAGPDCCKDGCPYYGETTGGTTCRARLLLDANIAINNEQALRESAEEENSKLRESCRVQQDRLIEERAAFGRECAALTADNKTLREELAKLHTDVDDLEAATNTLRAERDMLKVECNTLHMRNQVQQNEINALLLKNGGQDVKTDRPSVGFEGSTAYWCGRADALSDVMSRYFFGEASRHE